MYIFLSLVDEQILSLQHSTTMLKSLCSRITVLKVDLPLCPDDLYYCKLICRADHILLNKVSSLVAYLKLSNIPYIANCSRWKSFAVFAD